MIIQLRRSTKNNAFANFQEEKKQKIRDLLRKRLGEATSSKATSSTHSYPRNSNTTTSPNPKSSEDVHTKFVETIEKELYANTEQNTDQPKAPIAVPKKTKMIIPKVFQ